MAEEDFLRIIDDQTPPADSSSRQLRRAAETRRGLEIIIDAASTPYDFRSVQRLAEGILTQTASLLNCDCGGILMLSEGGDDNISVLAGSGICAGLTVAASLEPEPYQTVRDAFRHRADQLLPQRSILCIRTGNGRELAALIEHRKALSEADRALIQIVGSRLAVAFGNVMLYEQFQDERLQDEQLQAADAGLEERVRQRTLELQQANARLSAQWTRLQRANAFKGEALGAIAHDLKNSLGVILGRAEMLSEMVEGGASPVDNIKVQINHIRTAAHQVSEFISTLIADAMADALDITIRPETVDLVPLLRDLVEANQPLAARKRQTIMFAAPSAIELTCDSERIREAIDNVLSNAIKYSPMGGRIGVAINRGDLCAVIRITDQGPGLSAEDVARLFGRFQLLSAKPTGGESSTGLGLSIVKRIVDLHGGTVEVETTGPSGTTFKIAIPSA